VIAATVGTATAMEATTAAAVRTTTTTAAVATTTAMLSKSGRWEAHKGERSDSGKKNVEKGGFPHVSTLHPNTVGGPGGQPLSLLYWSLVLSGKLPQPRVMVAHSSLVLA
jgi:hypothetical protein